MGPEGIRIAVTGLGAVTALGVGRQATWEALLAGRSGIGRVRAWDTAPYKTAFAGEIRDFDPLKHFSRRQANRLDRCHQLAIVAAREALADAGLSPSVLDPLRTGIVIGTSLGGLLSGQRYDRTLLKTGRHLRACLYRNPFQVCADMLTAEFGFLGPRSIVSTACTASTIAIGQAMDLIRAGQADAILSGGADPLSEFSFAGFNAMQNVSPQPCAPFSEPAGLNTGEGAAMLILERWDRAQARGARIYAELLGAAMTADAYHATSSDPAGHSQRRMLVRALEESGVPGGAVDYVNAHGTGTLGNDGAETRVIRLVFGERAARLPVSSTKGALGHCLGATGAIEALVTVLAVHEDRLPPTVNFTRPRAGCTLDYVPNQARPRPVRVALSQNFAFGGNNAVLVFGKPDRPAAAPSPVPEARRVAITGLGVVSPIGVGRDAFLGALKAGASGIRPIGWFDTAGLASRLGGSMEAFDARNYSRADTRRLDRVGLFTVCAADLAFQDAGLKMTRDLSDRAGIVIGTSQGPIGSVRTFHREVALGCPEKANPGVFPNTVCNAAAGLAAIHLRLKGCNAVLTIGEASGLAAIGYGYDLIRRGAADILICGGVDQLERCLLEAYSVTRMISPRARGGGGGAEMACPFDRRRNGMVMGEGAGLVVLEALDSARARGVSVRGELLGYHSGADRPVSRGKDPAGEGVARCMQGALERAGVRAEEVDAVMAGALSDPLYDLCEARALRRVFGGRRVPVSAPASVFGMSAATGGLAVAAGLLGMKEGFIPCGLNPVESDPDCDLAVVAGAPRAGAPATILVNAMSLGGTNVSLVIRKIGEK